MTITLQRITLQNIRSYRDQITIEFPNGSILFQGDVGCGKSTILSAIEFALFGLGDVDGKHLLRSGEKKGSVMLQFQSNSKEYSVFRALSRKFKKVSQDGGYIIEDADRTDYSVTEMKARILEIININERPQAKTTSLLYRFAIFTPQEMMKQVITESEERRLEILRRAFGIEEYSTSKKNTSDIVYPWLREEAKVASALAVDLSQKKQILKDAQQRAEETSQEVERLSAASEKFRKSISDIQGKIAKLQDKKDILLRIEESIPRLKAKLFESEKQKVKAEENLRQLQKDLDDIIVSEQILETLKPEYDDYIEKKSKVLIAEQAVKNYEGLEKERIKLEKDLASEEKRISGEIERLQKEIISDTKEIDEDNASISRLKDFQSEELIYKEKLKELPTLRRMSENIARGISERESEKKSLQKEIEKRQKEIDQIIAIGDGAPCPKCKQRLTQAHIVSVRSDFSKEKRELETIIDDTKAALANLLKEKIELDAKIVALDQLQIHLEQVQGTATTLREKKRAIESKEIKLQEKRQRLDENRRIWTTEEYCHQEREQLLVVTTDMKKLHIVTLAYEELRKEIAKYETAKIEPRYSEMLQIVKRRDRVSVDMENTRTSIQELQNSIKSDTKELNDNEVLVEKDKGVTEELRHLQSTKSTLDDDFINNEKLRARKQSELDSINIKELEEEVAEKEKHNRAFAFSKQSQSWLSECFVPAIEDIEQHVLASINEEFSQLFQKWFNALIETGDISVEVDEAFTPMITQGGYELDVHSLSGGEKTSVALAYRLALNTMVKKVASMQSNLLILDEPTDGFSREQLIRLRQVLDELDASQIIMVSHERELESFVDNIYRVVKESGISRVELVKA
jgi:DNA repair protein SbcC/Rad50